VNSTDLLPGAGAHLAAELATQPDDWLTARDLARENAGLLPQPGERVAILGCGSSLYVGHAVAARREAAGQGETDTWPAGDTVPARRYDRIVAITRSGTTTEVLDALDRLAGRAPVTVITADPTSPVADRGEVISLEYADEQSVVQSRSMTSAVAMFRWHLGEDLTGVVEEAREVLALDDSWFDELRRIDQFSFVGAGWAYGLAEEAALKLKESTQAWTESWHQSEYRHGPISIAEPGRAVWAFGPLIPNFERDVKATDATLVHSELDPLAELLKVHRLCLLRATDHGLDADRPRNLTRSIILDS
jgi:fructoselysine-6-P-deglycase FrlB-like protein